MKSKSRLLWETSLAMPNNSTLHYLNPSNIEIFFKREEIRNHYHFFVELRNGSPTSVYLTLTASPCTWFGVRVAGDARTVFARTTSTFPWVGFLDMDSSKTNWLQNYLSKVKCILSLPYIELWFSWVAVNTRFTNICIFIHPVKRTETRTIYYVEKAYTSTWRFW